jgi:hypothetical protein
MNVCMYACMHATCKYRTNQSQQLLINLSSIIGISIRSLMQRILSYTLLKRITDNQDDRWQRLLGIFNRLKFHELKC